MEPVAAYRRSHLILMRELADHILDLMRNSLEAGADEIALQIVEDPAADRIEIVVSDNGRGLSQADLARVTDAAYTTRTTRRWGLGLALLQGTCDQCAGALEIQSEPGRGTQVRARLQLSHLDRPPLGHIGSVLQAMACHADEIRLRYRHVGPDGEFSLDTAALPWEQEEPLLTPAGLCRLSAEIAAGMSTVGSTA